MNKWMKGIIITLAAVVACAGLYLTTCFVLWNLLSEMPSGHSVPLITDYSLTDEKTYKIEKGSIEISIPTYYTSCQEVKEVSSYVCDAHLKNKQLLIIYAPFNQVADKIMPGFSQTYDETMAEFKNENLPFPLSLTHTFPDDLFGVMKEVYQLDKSNYNFWNLNDALYLYYCYGAKIGIEQEGLHIHSMYERGNVRAITIEDPEEPGTYVVMIFPNSGTGNMYAMIIQTSDTNDITKLLNTYEFK